MTGSKGGLSRKLALSLLGVLLSTSMVFLLLFFGIYQLQLKKERSQASQEVNLLLQASLENAMLKRDLSGLQNIVDRLGMQPAVIDVVILNPRGEVRFAAGHERMEQQGVGRPFEQPLDELCPGCGSNPGEAEAGTRFMNNNSGQKILRSASPVHNRAACFGCHGSVEQNPVNGILIVDYDATPITRKARSGVLGLMTAGLFVMLTTMVTVWWFMRRNVISPLSHLMDASRHLAQGNLAARITVRGDDEFSELGDCFNQMADRLQASLDQLLEKESYLQALIDAVPDGIRVIDDNFQVVNANQAYRQQLKLDPQHVVHVPCYQSSHRRDSPCPPTMITCPVNEIRTAPEPVKTMQEFTASDGMHARVQVFAAPLQVEVEGRPRRFVVESIRDLMHDIRFSREQKLTALGQLASGVGHEIRNPLSSIRLALQATLRKLDNDVYDREEISKYLKLVDGEIDKCIDVTERLLKLSSLTGDSPQLVDINVAIEETVSLLRYEGEHQGIRVELALASDHPRVYVVESDIRMLVLNIVQNAFHAMPGGGLLAITSFSEAGKAVCIFTDTGVGIAPEHLLHIFEPFFSHRADNREGTGLGLTICQSIVERYQGDIEVVNTGPEDTRFRIRLPLAGGD